MKHIAIFAGSNCIKEREDYYFDLAYTTGKLLADSGFTVVTGGGPGLMHHALRGAAEAGGETMSVLLNLAGRTHSSYAINHVAFDKLNPRQDKLIQLGDAYIALPGGIGTMYEICNIMALKMIGEIPKDKPMIIIGDYFKPLIHLFQEIVGEGFAAGDMLDCYTMVATPQEAVSLLPAVPKM